MAARLAELYLSTAPKSVQQILTAVAERDLERIRATAHNLKSASATIGAQKVSQLARQLESMASTGERAADCVPLAAKLEAAFRDAQAAIKQACGAAKKRQAG